MRASEAREVAGWFQRESQRMQEVVDECAATGADFKFTGLDYDERATRYRRAAVALDAYADGIDAPEFRATSSDTNRLHRIRARLLDLVPLDGTMSMADDVQRLDRALADARQHALLAALWTVCTPRELELKVPAALSPEAAEAFAHEIIDTVGAAIRDDLLALAKEAP